MARTSLLAIGPLLVACGGGGGGGGPDATPTPDADTSLCAGKPCLTSIDDEADWAAVAASYTGIRCDFLEDGKYLAPATPSAALQEIVFHDVKTHRLHLEFMTQELPAFFGGLSPQMYQEIVQRRATRQYWAGSIFRLVDEAGQTEGYGFDVIVDPTNWEEDLTEVEVGAIEQQLETAFHLPLIYAPTRPEAIYLSHSFTEVDVHYSRACQYVTCPNAGVDCVVVPSAVSLCGHFREGRTIDVEHARKATLAAVPGTYDLPRTAGTHTVPAIFGAGEYGPARIPIVPASASATYTVTDYGTFLARDYAQAFTAGAETIELTWQISLPQEGGGFLLEEPYFAYWLGMFATIGPDPEYDESIGFASCVGADLQHWRIDGTMAGGDGFVIDFQYVEPGGGSGPLFPTRGSVTLGGETTTVTDYFDLVYAGEHHNWNNQYWVLFDAPVTYNGHPVHGLWLDEQPYMFELEAAYTLDAAHQPLDTLTVTSYEVARVLP